MELNTTFPVSAFEYVPAALNTALSAPLYPFKNRLPPFIPSRMPISVLPLPISASPRASAESENALASNVQPPVSANFIICRPAGISGVLGKERKNKKPRAGGSGADSDPNLRKKSRERRRITRKTCV